MMWIVSRNMSNKFKSAVLFLKILILNYRLAQYLLVEIKTTMPTRT